MDNSIVICERRESLPIGPVRDFFDSLPQIGRFSVLTDLVRELFSKGLEPYLRQVIRVSLTLLLCRTKDLPLLAKEVLVDNISSTLEEQVFD